MSVAVSSPLPSPSFDGLAVAAEERYIGSVLSDNERSGDSSPSSADDSNGESLFSSAGDAPSAAASSILATLRGANGSSASSPSTSPSSTAVRRPLSPHTASTDRSEQSASSVLSSYPAWLRAQDVSVFDGHDNEADEEDLISLPRADSSPSRQRAISPPAYSPTASTLSAYSNSSPLSVSSAVLRPLTHSPPSEIEYLTARLEQLHAGEQHRSDHTATKQHWTEERARQRSSGSVPDILQPSDRYLPTRSQSVVVDSRSSSPPTSLFGRSTAFQPLSSPSHSIRDGSDGAMDGRHRSAASSDQRLRSSSTTHKPQSHAQSYLSNGARRTSIPDELPSTRFSPSTASTVSSSRSVSPHGNPLADEARQRSMPASAHFSPLSSPSLFSQQFASLPLSVIVSRGLLIDLCTDQYGSRFIQQKLEVCTDEERDLAFHAITASDRSSSDVSQLVVSLSLDVFANYTIQKLMEVCTAAQQRTLCLSLVGSVLLLSLQTYGCRVVQKAMEVATVDVQAELVAEIDGHAMALMTDQNGNHVVQKCIECCPATLLDPLLHSVRTHIYRLASHPYGCRVTQRMLEHGSAGQRQLIMDEIVAADGNYALLDLMRSSFGNYVAQGTMVHGSSWHRRRLCDAVKGHVAALSRHKFASNVMEKCLTHADRADQQSLINEIMGEPNSATSSLSLPFLDLCSDPYGNYVLQRLLNVIEEEQRVDLLWRLKRFVPHLKKIPYGKHILARIERMSFAAIGSSDSLAGVGGGITEQQQPIDGGVGGSRLSGKAGGLSGSGGGRVTPQYPPGFHHLPQQQNSPTRASGGGAGRTQASNGHSSVAQQWDSPWTHSVQKQQQHADHGHSYGSSTRYVPFNR